MNRLIAALGLAVLFGCGPAEPQATDCKSKYPVSQQSSMPCCPEWGLDACGANLFCAALDGRTQPTCYLDHSKADMTDCTEDSQCQSAFCNKSVGKCRSQNFRPCAANIGCSGGSNWACGTTPGYDGPVCH